MATKTIKFDDDKEKELLEFLQTLPHGDFSKDTKIYWQNRLDSTKVHPKDPNAPKRYMDLSEIPMSEVPPLPPAMEEMIETIRAMVNKEITTRMQSGRKNKRAKEEEIT